MANDENPGVYVVNVLEGLGFLEGDAQGRINHDFGEIVVEWYGRRITEGIITQAFVSSYFWRIGVRIPTLVVVIKGLRVEGQAELWPGEPDLLLTNFLARLGGKEHRQHLGDADFEAHYGIHAPTEEEARQALPEPLRRALLTAALRTHVRLTPDHIALFPTSGSADIFDRRDLARHTVRLAEAIQAVLPLRA